MITKEQVLNSIAEMLIDDYGHILKVAIRLLDSGAVDLSNYDNDYRLPKIVLHAIYKDMQYWRLPTREEDLEAVKNLENF